MRKQSTKRATSVPPFRQQLLRWHPIPMPKGKSEAEPSDYEKGIQLWLRSWDPFCEGVPIGSYKDGRSLIWEDKVNGSTFQKFRKQTISEELRMELIGWAARTATRCDPILRRLFDRHKVSPLPVLDILGSWKGYFLCYRDPLKMSGYLRSEKRRKVHSRALFKAATILRLLKPLYPYTFPVKSYPKAADLETIAGTLLEFGGPQANRPEELELKDCARQLAQLFRRKTSKSLPEYVGRLILASFPDQWNPAGDVKEAAKKLLKEHRASANGRRSLPV